MPRRDVYKRQDEVKTDPFLQADLFKALNGHFDALVQIEGGNIQKIPSGSVLVQLQQFLGEFLQAFGLKNDHIQIALLLSLIHI